MVCCIVCLRFWLVCGLYCLLVVNCSFLFVVDCS